MEFRNRPEARLGHQGGIIMGYPRKVVILCFACLVAAGWAFSQTEESAKVLGQAGPGIIRLVVLGKDKQEIAKGSAFALTQNIAATSYHLICQAAGASGFNSRKRGVDIEGVVAVDKNLDLALIRFDGRVSALELGSDDELAAGKKIFGVGLNESGEIMVSDGTVRTIIDLGSGLKVADSSLAMPDTFSGGAVIGESGKVVGLIQCVDRLKFIVPASAVAALPQSAKPVPLKSWTPDNYLDSFEATWLLGRLCAWQNDLFNAQRYLDRVTRAKPDLIEAWVLLAGILSKQRDYQGAVAAYQKIIDLDPKRADAYFGQGQVLVRMQRSNEAAAALEKAIELAPDNKEAYLFLGNAYEDSRQFQKAGDAYEKYLATNPENAWTVYQRLGTCRLNANQFDQAIAAFLEALKSQPKDQKINTDLGQAYEKSGKLDQAEEVYKNLAQLSAKDAAYYYSLILNMYDKSGEPAKAAEAAKKIVELRPNDEQALYNLGYMYQKMQKYDEAIATFQKVIALKPTFEYAHFQIGYNLYNLKRYKEAAEAFKKFTELSPDNGDGWLFMAMSYMQVRDFNAALGPAKKATELKPDNGHAWYNLAICYLNLKDRFSAVEVQKKLQSVDPDLAAKLKALIK
jgi:tetratricopeptide (TPR) repeat protein